MEGLLLSREEPCEGRKLSALSVRCRFEREKISGGQPLCHRGRGQAGGNKPAEIFCYEYHAHYAGVKRKACGGKPAAGFSCGREKLWKYCGRPMRKLPCGEFCRPLFRKRRAMSIWNRAVNLSLSGSALTELLQKGTGCPWIWRRDCRCGPKSWAVWTWGKTAFPRTEAFRKSGMEKIQISVFP